MTDHAASRRAFLGATAAGAGAAAFSALSLDRALAESAPATSPAGPAGSTTSAAGLDPFQTAAALPPHIPGTLTKTFMFSDAQGFAVGAVSPLAWSSGGYQPGGGFIDVALGLEEGATIKRVDVYVQRSTIGTALIVLNRSTIATTASGTTVDTITTASGTGVLTGGKSMTVPVGAGEQYYLESPDFGSSARTFLGAIVTYFPATPQLHLLDAPVRIYDSRPGQLPTAIGPKTPLANGASRAIDCTTGGAVPAGAKAALVNFTVVNTSPTGFMALFKNGVGWPGNSSINWDHGNEVIATTTIVALDSTAKLAAYASGSADLIFDVIGFYA